MNDNNKNASSFNPKVSIIIPVYNGEKYLEEAILSALSQDYTNFEIIIVNDGSQDSTAAIAEDYAKRYDQIKYFSKENGGCGSALNYALDKLTGEYFSWLSHDDVYLPNKLSEQIAILNKLENKDTILYASYATIDAKSRKLHEVMPHTIYDEECLNKPLFPLLRGLLHGCSMLVPVKFFNTIGRFNENLKTTQDYDLWFRFLRKCEIKYIPEILIKSRIHPDQGTHKIKEHIEECNKLWIGFIENITDFEMLGFEKNYYDFLKNMYVFLQTTPYKGATNYVYKMLRKLYPHKKIKNYKIEKLFTKLQRGLSLIQSQGLASAWNKIKYHFN